MVFSLLSDEGRIVGALGMNLRSGNLLLFPAQAVILATVGGASIFKRHNNTRWTTGDGYILGLEINEEGETPIKGVIRRGRSDGQPPQSGKAWRVRYG